MKHLFTTLFLATALAAQAGIPGDVLTNLSSPDLAKRFEAETKLRQLAFETGKPGADPAKAASLEKDLLSLAADTKAPEPSRLSALEQLPFFGSASSVSGLAALLADPTPIIRENARCALQNNPAPAASVPLLQALEKADQPAWTLGLMDSLASRADTTAIPAFAARLTSPNPAIASLAAQSLGSIGGKESFEALNNFLPNCPPSILPVAQSALVRCALPLTKDPTGFWGRLVAAAEKFIGMPTAAESIVALWPKASNAAVRCEIFNALASIGDGSQAAPIVSDLLAKQDTPGVREILRMAVLSGNPFLKDPVLVALPNLNEDARLSVHATLAEKSDTSREDDLLALAAALDGSKRASAIEILASCGTEKSLEFLLAEVGKKSPQTLPSASLALNRLKIAGLDQRLIEQAKSKPDEKTITLLSMRNPEGTEALFLKLAAPDSPADLNKIVLSSLETVGGYDTGVQLINWIAQAPEGSDSKPYIAAFRKIVPRVSAEAALWQSAFLPAFQSASAENRKALIYTIPALRCPQSGATLVEWIRSDADLRPTAIDQLVSWPGFEAGDLLLAAAQIPDLDEPSREKLFKAATKLFLPTVQAQPAAKKAYAKKVLAAAPEGPIRDAVQQAMTSSNL
jgi:HEAT repeat protein